jgi:hypothetical protein
MMKENGTMTRADLERVRDWTQEQLTTGDQPPWAWFQYMKLRETLDAILAGMDATVPLDELTKERSQRSAPRPGTHLRLVADTDSRDTAPPRSSELAARLPM